MVIEEFSKVREDPAILPAPDTVVAAAKEVPAEMLAMDVIDIPVISAAPDIAPDKAKEVIPAPPIVTWPKWASEELDISPASLIRIALFAIVAPSVPLKRTMALSVEDPGPLTSPPAAAMEDLRKFSA